MVHSEINLKTKNKILKDLNGVLVAPGLEIEVLREKGYSLL